ncbi:MAG: hypothetical protein A2086_05195 [Spirochaetes bacterium GWD1_27_9]|nr:MAG: hypothetical protein A2Z98_17515 [Spirochaetes bacterium GWB1_27_13]OHD25552.1 MAG: hypothetical protein A2Y34_06965 [Spirochaetes bacterium GWC1_27_15]OHD43859.1 MAG: hypothetical protein A2086_05195 [Spirochaetes bacterium GWD1_27_9]
MQLKKELNLLDVFCIATGAMISSGLFILPGIAYGKTGASIFVSYLLAGFLAITGMLSQIELGTAMPKAGGTYFFVTRTMGSAVGTINGLLTWLSISLKSAFALVGIATFTNLVVDVNIKLIAIFICILFVLLNLFGVKEASKFQIILVFLLIGVLIVYIFYGIFFVKVKNFENFSPYGVLSIFSTAGFVFVAYGGLLDAVSIAEEVKNPSKNIPYGMILGLIVTILFYVAAVFITVGVLDGKKLALSLMPISDAAFVFMGNFGRIFLGLAAIFAFVTTANAGVMAASRYPMALSRDKLLPSLFGRISVKFKTPYFAIILTGFFMILVLLLDLEVLVKTASTVLIVSNMLSIISLIIIREAKLQNYKPSFKSPFYPFIQIIGILSFLYLLINIGFQSLIITTFLFLTGFLIFFFYGRKKNEKEFAFLHLIERITSKVLTNHSLEKELKEIIIERDEIKKDRFDSVIEESLVLDIEKKIDLKELFNIISQKMSLILNIESKKLINLLEKREKESSTAITNFIAIPHIVIPQKHIFKAMLVRCKNGIYFSEEAKDVKAIFVFVGSKTERNFHLKYLAAISQVCQEEDFEKKWIDGKTTEVLRDIVLLGKRRR